MWIKNRVDENYYGVPYYFGREMRSEGMKIWYDEETETYAVYNDVDLIQKIDRFVTDDEMSDIASYMEDDLRESLHFELAPCSNEKFLKAYCEKKPEFKEFIQDVFGISIN